MTEQWRVFAVVDISQLDCVFIWLVKITFFRTLLQRWLSHTTTKEGMSFVRKSSAPGRSPVWQNAQACGCGFCVLKCRVGWIAMCWARWLWGSNPISYAFCHRMRHQPARLYSHECKLDCENLNWLLAVMQDVIQSAVANYTMKGLQAHDMKIAVLQGEKSDEMLFLASVACKWQCFRW